MDTAKRIASNTKAGMVGPRPARRLIAIGTISRRGGRTTTVRATEAGVTGTITSTCTTCRLIFEACTCTGGAR
ncbi:hypothetical protein [Streptomyces anulatus]|uniref:hypothetical protein n=1 Tax=Streptomyces anulatus TaxID=1892 RepID=UPI001D192FCA|nr:hypothetical protein [Streptomyces anulatus]